MELTKKQVKMTKGIAILFMLLLHLFCTKSYGGLYTPLILIEDVPLVYYLALFGDCCVAIYCFVVDMVCQLAIKIIKKIILKII